MSARKRTAPSGSRLRLTEAQKVYKNNVEKKEMLSTMFFDPVVMAELGLHTCTQMMFIHCGLGDFYFMSAPTFREWTIDFLTTLEDDPEQSRITFQLAGEQRIMSYADIDAALGITKQPSDYAAWNATSEYLDFWVLSTRTRLFDPKTGEYNYKWSHPCLRLAHKVIRLAWLGQSEVNKVPTVDLEAIWSMTPKCTLVRDWRALFLASCKKFRSTKKCKITVGGMVSLLARHLRIPFPDSSHQLTSHFTYDIRQLKQSGMIRLVGSRRRYLYGSRGCFEMPIPLPIEMPWGPEYADFDLSRFALGQAGASSSAAPALSAPGPSVPVPFASEEATEEDDDDTMDEAEHEAEPLSSRWAPPMWEAASEAQFHQPAGWHDLQYAQTRGPWDAQAEHYEATLSPPTEWGYQIPQPEPADVHPVDYQRQMWETLQGMNARQQEHYRQHSIWQRQQTTWQQQQTADLRALEEQMHQWNAFMSHQYPGFPDLPPPPPPQQ